jgi:hypothetical protein
MNAVMHAPWDNFSYTMDVLPRLWEGEDSVWHVKMSMVTLVTDTMLTAPVACPYSRDQCLCMSCSA